MRVWHLVFNLNNKVLLIFLSFIEIMKIASWNVNSIRARLEHVLSYCQNTTTDVILLQELKTTDENFPRELFLNIGWQVATHGQKTYNGVAIISKKDIDVTQVGLDGDETDEQARYIEAQIEDIRIASIYLPNGNPCPGPKFDYKLNWMDRLFNRAKKLFYDEIPVVLGGDFNVIPQPIDCYEPSDWEEDALYTKEVRKKFYALCNLGYLDALRQIRPTGAHYTFWDYQRGAWQKDNGIRIDHLLLSPEAANRLIDCQIDKKPRGLEKASDHTPIWCILS